MKWVLTYSWILFLCSWCHVAAIRCEAVTDTTTPLWVKDVLLAAVLLDEHVVSVCAAFNYILVLLTPFCYLIHLNVKTGTLSTWQVFHGKSWHFIISLRSHLKITPQKNLNTCNDDVTIKRDWHQERCSRQLFSSTMCVVLHLWVSIRGTKNTYMAKVSREAHCVQGSSEANNSSVTEGPTAASAPFSRLLEQQSSLTHL